MQEHMLNDTTSTIKIRTHETYSTTSAANNTRNNTKPRTRTRQKAQQMEQTHTKQKRGNIAHKRT